MNIEQKLLENVELKLNKQNSVYASLGAAFWIAPILIIWHFVHAYNLNFGPIMLLASGSIIGLAVRIHGKGMTLLFPVLAFITYTWIALLAMGLDMVLGTQIWPIFLFGLYILGAGIAIYLARIEVPFEEHKAYTYLTSIQMHESSKKFKNRWFIAFPVLVLMATFISYITTFSLLVLDEHQTQNEQFQLEQKQRQIGQNKEIDITPESLKDRKTREVLFYSYAYHSGLLFNKRGTNSQPFPKSEYKAKTILKYLVEHRANARAKFILGLLTEGVKSQSLIKDAAKQGDKYAQIHSTIEYGCYSNSELALELLNKLRKISREEYILKEIDSILYLGFDQVCLELEDPKFLASYILNYQE